MLEGKAHRGALDHLGELAEVSLYDNRQIEVVSYVAGRGDALVHRALLGAR